MKRHSFIVPRLRFGLALKCPLVILLLLIISGAPLAHAQDVKQTLSKFLASYCNDCHAGGAEEGGLSFDKLGTELSDAATFAKWERIYDRVREGEMPPEEETQPSAAHRSAFTRLLGEPLTKSHAASKGTALRRLNRREYQNTMNDLFGTSLDLERMLPEDSRFHEFDNVGETLSVSMTHLLRYIEAADMVFDAAMAKTTEAPKPKLIECHYRESEIKRALGKTVKQLNDGALVRYSPSGLSGGHLRGGSTPKAGKYRIRITGYAYQSDKPVVVAVSGTSYQPGSEQPRFGFFGFPPGKPTTIEFVTWIDRRYMLKINPYGIHDPDHYKRTDISTFGGPGFAMLSASMEGPLVDEFPSRGHRLVFDGVRRVEIEPRNPGDKKKRWYKPKFEIVSEDLRLDVAQSLQRVASAAFRRLASEKEIERYLKLFDSQKAEGASIEESLRSAVAAIFCSPDFLYLREPSGQLDDHALASRLSYFLTRTTPDQPLLDAASDGKLARDPEALLAHTRRLLDDPRKERFIVDFTDAWLNLREIEFTSPDRTLFPEFDPFLHDSMLQETRRFFATLIKDNASVKNLVRSDFAILNSRLAKHYGIDGVSGPEFRRVNLDADSVRGGLLSQASILKVSANGTNTSPVVRGIWVMERILGQTPPPPPAGVPGVEPDIRGASTLREQLAKHRNVDTCRSCHVVIDPPGFAMESFNPIGGWRDHYRSLGEGQRIDLEIRGRNVRYRRGPEVDASGELPDGRKFGGFREFRDTLAANEDVLARTLITKLLTFATGREMGFSDRDEIEKLVQSSKTKGHRISDLIESVVFSAAFRRK